MQFLNQASLAEHELDKCWMEQIRTTDVSSFNRKARDAYDKLDPLLNIVLLEGPSDVGDACKDLQSKILAELLKVTLLFNAATDPEMLASRNKDVCSKMYLERGEARDDLISNARQALNDDSS